jgi:hypothetical protein
VSSNLSEQGPNTVLIEQSRWDEHIDPLQELLEEAGRLAQWEPEVPSTVVRMMWP